MPQIGFTVFKNQILNGVKTQTIRRPRKRRIRIGDRLYLYWKLRTKECEKLGTTVCVDTYRLPWRVLKHHDLIARRDGFRNSEEMREWFHKPKDGDVFDVIVWKYPFLES